MEITINIWWLIGAAVVVVGFWVVGKILDSIFNN